MKQKSLFIALALLLSLCSAAIAGAPVEWTPERTAFHPELWTEYNGRPMYTEKDIPSFITNKQTTFKGVAAATGATVTKEGLLKEDASKYKVVSITDAPYNATAGARDTDSAHANTLAINQALLNVSAAGGGTVKIPKGEFSFYTIHLQNNANIFLEDAGSIILAALPSEKYSYDPPENNPYIGLMDFGHSHFANSLIYGIGIHDVMIYGEGLISGCYYNEKTGYLFTTMTRGGNSTATTRSGLDLPEAATSWLPSAENLAAISTYGVIATGDQTASLARTANKAIALHECQNIVLSGFDMLNVGHFAFISAGVTNCLIENIVIDSNRDGLDIDTIKDCTVRNCVINTLRDDAIVVKASYGVGKMFKTENILVYNNVVSAYDPGSAMAGTFTQNSPLFRWNGRFKIGTEATTGFDRITVANLLTVHSTGFALESVDGQPLTNVICYNLLMDDIMFGPLYIAAGDRARYPVTDHTADDTWSGVSKVRPAAGGFDQSGGSGSEIYVIPNAAGYEKFPIQRYQPNITTEGEPLPNPINYTQIDGKYYLYKWNGSGYEPDTSKEIPEADLGRYAVAVGAPNLATVENVYFGSVVATNANPMIPIEIYGMVSGDTKYVKNITLEDIDVTYRGGLTPRFAIDSPQLIAPVPFPAHDYMQPPVLSAAAQSGFTYSRAARINSIPRMYQDESGNWHDDPYNVPEMSAGGYGSQYPEPSNYGTLPAYGLYARGVDGMTVRNFKAAYDLTDTRPGIVLDNVHNAAFSGVSVEGNKAVLVTHNYKRPVNWEHYPNEPYVTTTVSNVTGLDNIKEEVTVVAPQPGTPSDSLYPRETDITKDEAAGYVPTTEFPFVLYRPFIGSESKKVWTVKAGDTVSVELEPVNPADYIEAGKTYPITVACTEKPEGSEFDGKTFTWTIGEDVAEGTYHATFTLVDTLNLENPAKQIVTVNVTKEEAPDGKKGGGGCDTGAAFFAVLGLAAAGFFDRKK
ncbi:MAG: right-handed parallel beta-helix repeat-containing protein [Synergistaceae bacterium]|nr:right-handed parallel beta-helix repeat-containing protein [Synergistaceae bacterium]